MRSFAALVVIFISGLTNLARPPKFYSIDVRGGIGVPAGVLQCRTTFQREKRRDSLPACTTSGTADS
jgi:hypothetical protein